MKSWASSSCIPIRPHLTKGLPRWLSDKESVSQCRKHRRHRFDPWVGKIPWRKNWQPTPVYLPGESHGQRSLVIYSSRGCKESDTTEQLSDWAHMHTIGPHFLAAALFMDTYSPCLFVVSHRYSYTGNSEMRCRASKYIQDQLNGWWKLNGPHGGPTLSHVATQVLSIHCLSTEVPGMKNKTLGNLSWVFIAL